MSEQAFALGFLGWIFCDWVNSVGSTFVDRLLLAAKGGSRARRWVAITTPTVLMNRAHWMAGKDGCSTPLRFARWEEAFRRQCFDIVADLWMARGTSGCSKSVQISLCESAG